jgi:hypothetical protein
MNALLFSASVLDAKIGFEAAALLVTWAAIAFLTIIAMHLHLRLQRLERASTPAAGTRPYGHFVGSGLEELLGDMMFAFRPQLVVALSGACKACERVLSEITAPGWTAPTVVLWTDHTPSVVPVLPANAIVSPNGPILAAKLGIRITPFALWINQEGKIVKASPVNSLRSAGASLDRSVQFQTATKDTSTIKTLQL